MIMKSTRTFHLHLWLPILSLNLLLFKSFALTTDGILLLSFKYNVISDPLRVLQNWNYNDATPCSWNGVVCGGPKNPGAYYNVTSLSLPNSQLLASIPENLGMIQNLQVLNLSNNSINGSLPVSLYNATGLKFLDLSNNMISGELEELVGGLKSLQFLNLSDNALGGNLPQNLSILGNLSVVSLKSNYFYGNLPSGFDSVKFLDLSSNLLNGSLPDDFGSDYLNYFNVSYNRISGEIPEGFANKINGNATIDLSFNNLTGQIPDSNVFVAQGKSAFLGNSELCGSPLAQLCPIPSTLSTPPNVSTPTASPAIAAIPKTMDASNSDNSSNTSSASQNSSFPITTIVGIVVGDIAGIAVLAMAFICILKRRKRIANEKKESKQNQDDFDWASSASDENKWLRSWPCLMKSKAEDGQSSSDSASSDGEVAEKLENLQQQKDQEKKGELVLIEGTGETELELETLLKASAYILGASGSSIIYKAVLEDGRELAVRRIGESGLERFKDFENQVRVIAKLVHPNLVRIRGFYWGKDEKLVIYDYVANGSLANARYRKVGSSPCPLPWEKRLKIARGTARGLAYIHDKKQVHGNLKPTNILLGPDMEPKIGDFGLERLVIGDVSYKAGSARHFGSKRSTASRDSFQDSVTGPNPSPSPSSVGCISPYYAPESLRSLKPSAKWDVYSYGVVLLELLTGKVIVSDEFGPASMTWNAVLLKEEKSKILRMADVAIRADMEGKEDALLALLKLGYSCISPVPQKRPTMKEVLHVLEKFPSSIYIGHL